MSDRDPAHDREFSRESLVKLLATMTPAAPPKGIVYRHYDAESTLLYIGSVEDGNLRERHVVHSRQARWWRYIDRVEHEPVTTRREAFLAESEAIRIELPVFNRTAFGPRAVDQAEREAVYIRTHAHLPDASAWRTPEMTRQQRRVVLDQQLARIGLPPRSGPILLRRGPSHPVLDLGEHLAEAHFS